MVVRFYADNWLTASAGVGLLKALEHKGIEWEPFLKGNVIELPEDLFKEIGKIYADYLLSDFNQDTLKNLLEKERKKEFNLYNSIAYPKIGDFYSNSPIVNPSKTGRANAEFKKFYEKEKNIELLYSKAVDVVRNFIKEQFDELLGHERSQKVCFFCRERKAYIKDKKVKVFEATNFTPLAASPNTVENFFWNGKSNMYMCPECEIFMYFSAFAFQRTLRGTYMFVYTPDLRETFSLNDILAKEGSVGIISKTILEVAKTVQQRKSEWVLRNIYIVEIEKVGDAQANIHTLSLSPRLASALKDLIKDYPKYMEGLFDLFIEYVYSGRSLYEFLWSVMSGFFFKNRYKNLQGRKSLLVKKGTSFKDYLPYGLLYFVKFQEVLNMEDKDKVNKQVNWAYAEGKSLWEAYTLGMGEERAKKKVEVLSYRILDAIRRKDIDAFQQNIIRAYLEVEKEIPYVFVEALRDRSFNRVAYAFLIGLNSKGKQEEQETI
ncbi:type I-B CRISPR-associated protein Cas8b1/Cst1 [Hydrogenobacter hydrogenophilus]|uniref:CRISPR-associated protein Cst1 n=1 Tax=Hydrogenobacter hydrogenophilus TaxID=35835 RepID=A0A285P8E6_9AQUI|nr:type I-B CRISPR-associated protein Cas8b1/Cst1 [Hydrogenobacter hydrogenophilus]SNZ16151.1 CRISPR-associated protein Cst1 [Hydrogenobacter hydrogenophilus]